MAGNPFPQDSIAGQMMEATYGYSQHPSDSYEDQLARLEHAYAAFQRGEQSQETINNRNNIQNQITQLRTQHAKDLEQQQLNANKEEYSKEADALKQSMPADFQKQNALGSDIMKGGLKQDLTNNAYASNKQGLLYSGLHGRADTAAYNDYNNRNMTAQQVISKRLQDQQKSYEDAAAASGLDVQQNALSDAAMRQQQYNSLYANQFRTQQAQDQATAGLLGGLGSAAGTALGAAKSSNEMNYQPSTNTYGSGYGLGYQGNYGAYPYSQASNTAPFQQGGNGR